MAAPVKRRELELNNKHNNEESEDESSSEEIENGLGNEQVGLIHFSLIYFAIILRRMHVFWLLTLSNHNTYFIFV